MASFDFDSLADSLVANRGLHRSSLGTVFGEIDGQPVHVGEGVDNNGTKHVAVIVGTSSNVTGEVTKDMWVETFDDVKKGMVTVNDDALAVQIPLGKAAKFGDGEFEKRVDDLVAIAVTHGKVVPARSGARPGLVNGVPRYLSEGEVGELTLEGDQASAEYSESKPRLMLGILGGLLGMVVSALVWAGIAIAAEREFWVIGIGAGLLIGFLTLRGMQKTNLAVQILIGGLTIAAVILGQLLTLGWLMNDQFGVVDAGVVFEVYGEIISEDTGTVLFALAAGLFGAWYGAKLGRKPQIAPEIEIAPA